MLQVLRPWEPFNYTKHCKRRYYLCMPNRDWAAFVRVPPDPSNTNVNVVANCCQEGTSGISVYNPVSLPPGKVYGNDIKELCKDVDKVLLNEGWYLL